jgi:WD40 repeat protein
MKKKQSTLSISSSDLEISDPPKDTISSLKFSIIDNILLSTSWDNNLYIYKIDQNKSLENQIEKDITQFNESLIATQVFSNPQLDCAFEGNDINYFYSVGLDSDIKRIDLELLSSTIIGSHQQPINKVVYDNSHQCVFTTGWDGYLKRFDHRQNYNGMLTITEINLEMISSGITLSNESLIIAGFDNMYNHIVKIFDVRNLNNISKVYESPLKFQTSSICSNNKGDGFVMGSIEGKICVEYLEQQESIHTQSTTPINKNYAFKCHREETESQTFIYPVNCLSYHCR